MIKLELSYRSIFLILGLLVGVWAFLRVWPFLLLVFAALILMAALYPYVEWLVRRGIPRTLAVALIYLGIVLVAAGLIAAVVPAIVNQFRDISDTLPEDARDLQNLLADIGINVELEERARDIDWGGIISGQVALDYTQRVIFAIVSIISVLVLSAYLLADSPRLSRFIFQFVPPGREPEVESLLHRLSFAVGGYIRGQVVTSLVIGFFTLAVLLAVGVPNPVALAVLAAFVDIIPIVGAVIAVVIPTLAAFQQSPTQAIIVLVALFAYQQFEDRWFAPRVYGQTMNLPPIVVLIVVLAGAQLLGIVGVLLALPAAAAARVGLDYYMERRVLGPAPVLGQTAAAPESGEHPVAPDIEVRE